MNDIKKGQKVWVSLRNEIKETAVKSVGSKYITLEYDSRVKFNRQTLRDIVGTGVGCLIILDIEKYKKDNYYHSLVREIKRFDWGSMDREDLDKIADILREY